MKKIFIIFLLIKLNILKINKKVVILAGGFGTRISEYTKTIPKQ